MKKKNIISNFIRSERKVTGITEKDLTIKAEVGLMSVRDGVLILYYCYLPCFTSLSIIALLFYVFNSFGFSFGLKIKVKTKHIIKITNTIISSINMLPVFW